MHILKSKPCSNPCLITYNKALSVVYQDKACVFMYYYVYNDVHNKHNYMHSINDVYKLNIIVCFDKRSLSFIMLLIIEPAIKSS